MTRGPRHLLHAGIATSDPLWRLPLWPGYDGWLNSPVADINNVSTRPFAGAIVAALFLQRFVPTGISWAHVDMYAWNDADRAGPARGRRGAGDARGFRRHSWTLCRRIVRRRAAVPTYHPALGDRSTPVT